MFARSISSVALAASLAVLCCLAISLPIAQSADPATQSALEPPQPQVGQGEEAVVGRRLDRKQADLARKYQQLERAMFLLGRTGETKRQRELAAAAIAESRRLLIKDQCTALASDLAKDELYAAVKGQESLVRVQKNLLDLLQNSAPARLIDIEWRSMRLLQGSLDWAKQLRFAAGRLRRRFARFDWPLGPDRFHRTWHRVLLLAGGPTRDYRFLVAHLAHNYGIVVDALLQTAQPGSEQDVQRLLDHFPQTDAQMKE